MNRKEYHRLWRVANREKVAEKNRGYAAAHQGQIAARKRERRAGLSEAAREAERAAQRLLRDEKRAELNEYQRGYLKSGKPGALRALAKRRISKAHQIKHSDIPLEITEATAALIAVEREIKKDSAPQT